jgi:hypothetical protein
MEIPKDKIQQPLFDRGDQDTAQQADQQLPHPADAEQHRDLLAMIGIDLNDVSRGAGGKSSL